MVWAEVGVLERVAREGLNMGRTLSKMPGGSEEICVDTGGWTFEASWSCRKSGVDEGRVRGE